MTYVHRLLIFLRILSHKPSNEVWGESIEEYEQELKRREGVAP